MKRGLVALVSAVLVLGIAPAVADHDGSKHSDNVRHVSHWDQQDKYRQGSDLAFWGDVAVAGNYDNPGGFWLIDIADPQAPRLISQFECPGPQNDVAIWRDLVFLSVDSPRESSECGAEAAPTAQVLAGDHWEGIRVVSIADRERPRQIAAVATDCGSHTHTLVPDRANDRVLIYALSYPLGGQGSECNPVSHRRFSIVEVPLDDPTKASVIATPAVGPAVGCHDVTVLTQKQLAAAACITESQIWDISDPAAPTIVSHIYNPLINIHHSTAWSWDGKTIVIGDELGGAEVTPGCFTEGHAPLGAMWFYDVSDPGSPAQRGWFQTQNQEISLFCTAHNFNVVPVSSDKDILVTGWYNGGTLLVDFTDPSQPKQLGFYTPTRDGRTASWSSYWYNDYIYSNNFDEDVNSLTEESRGFDVFRYTGTEIEDAITVPHLNPQTQDLVGELFDVPGPRVLGREHRRVTPATGVSVPAFLALGLLLVSGLTARMMRARRAT